MKKFVLSIALAAFAAFTTVGNTAVIFTDTFTSGTAADAGYYRFGTTGTTLAVAGADLDFTTDGTAASRSGVIKSFTAQTLAVGDSITFSFDITSRSLASLQSNAFRWSIGNLGNPSPVTGAPVTADLTSAAPFSSGSRIFHSFSASTSDTAGYGGIINGQSSPVVNTSIAAYVGFAGPVSVGQTGVTSVSLTIDRTGTDSYSISQTAFGSSDTGTITGAVADANIFNTIAFSMNNAGALNFSLDNVQVSVVPEPATWVLLTGSLTALVVFRRRRQA